GRGFYRYDPEPPDDPPPPRSGDGQGRIITLAQGTWAPGLADLCEQAGYRLTEVANPSAVLAVAQAGRSEGLKNQLMDLDRSLPPGTPILCQCADMTAAE